MDIKTKIHTILSIALVTLIAALAYWVQLPVKDLKAELIDTDTVLVRIQDFAFDADVVRIEPETTVSWVHDESDGNADVQHTVVSYDPEDVANSGDLFESELMSLGDTFSNTFDEEGVYYYNCSLHPFMTGKVCVGDVSEILDEDCVLDVSEPEESLGEDEETLDEEEEVVEEDTDEEEDIEEEEVDEEEVTEDDEELSPAADEDFEEDEEDSTYIPPATDDPSAGTVVFGDDDIADTTIADATDSDEELADSGPESVLYLFFALVAGYIAYRRYYSTQG